MWDLLLNDDESMVVDAVREYLGRELPLERLRPNASPVDTAKGYAGLVNLGWLAIGLPEASGGSGLGLIGEMLVQRECGRFLVTPGALAAVLGAHVALQAGATDLAGQLVSGAASVALAVPPPAKASGLAPAYAFDWRADSMLVAWDERGMGLFDAAAFVGATAEACIDDSLVMHAGQLDMAAAQHWVDGEQSPVVLRAQVLMAAALVGLAEHACELTVEYAKVREQFGKPIGSFQAVKHRCADMGIRARLAWYQTSLAALKVQTGAPDAAAQAAAAKLLAAQAAHENGRAAIQLHGGIGFQAECDVHWFMKRAHLYDRAGGSIREQALRLVEEPSLLVS